MRYPERVVEAGVVARKPPKSSVVVRKLRSMRGVVYGVRTSSASSAISIPSRFRLSDAVVNNVAGGNWHAHLSEVRSKMQQVVEGISPIRAKIRTQFVGREILCPRRVWPLLVNPSISNKDSQRSSREQLEEEPPHRNEEQVSAVISITPKADKNVAIRIHRKHCTHLDDHTAKRRISSKLRLIREESSKPFHRRQIICSNCRAILHKTQNTSPRGGVQTLSCAAPTAPIQRSRRF
jgi:hypothetical protein